VLFTKYIYSTVVGQDVCYSDLVSYKRCWLTWFYAVIV